MSEGPERLAEDRSPVPEGGGRQAPPLRRSRGFLWIFGLLLTLIALSLFLDRRGGASDVEYDKTAIFELLRAGKLDPESLRIFPDERRIVGKIQRTPEEKEANLPERFVLDPGTETVIDEFWAAIDAYNVKAGKDVRRYVPIPERSNLFLWSTINQILMVLLLVGLFYFIFLRPFRSLGPGSGIFSFGKSQARLAKKGSVQVSFKDVAGIDEAKAEVEEIIEFLKSPEKFLRLGGRIPRGVVLSGPPGTGKTLLAKAIAGEAEVPFFSISGSDFVEMFVGVGASRVRDLFKQARENSPCIIFLDEIDAVGRRRGAGLGGGHDEREQTLNAILVEMDGFDTDAGIVMIAATNRPDVLDPALLRPGRFDREIVIDLPDVAGREAILRVHTQKVRIGSDVELRRLAQLTPTFSGAELAALVNEAAIIAAMRNQDAVRQEDLEEARDKLRFGRERASRSFTEEDLRVTAFHEAGHALVAHLLPEVEPLHKVTIIPRGMALGATMQIPERDRCHMSRKQLHGNLMVLYAGRIAEQLFCDDITAGATNDIERATDLARRMVCEWGMSDAIGPVHYAGNEETVFLGREVARTRHYGEALAQKIDDEIRRLIETTCQKTEKLLRKHREEVERIAQALLIKETLTGDEVGILAGGGAIPLEVRRPRLGRLDEKGVPIASAAPSARGKEWGEESDS
jgi:cell division protease FtsH